MQLKADLIGEQLRHGVGILRERRKHRVFAALDIQLQYVDVRVAVLRRQLGQREEVGVVARTRRKALGAVAQALAVEDHARVGGLRAAVSRAVKGVHGAGRRGQHRGLEIKLVVAAEGVDDAAGRQRRQRAEQLAAVARVAETTHAGARWSQRRPVVKHRRLRSG